MVEDKVDWGDGPIEGAAEDALGILAVVLSHPVLGRHVGLG
jgi:hypothetical protein